MDGYTICLLAVLIVAVLAKLKPRDDSEEIKKLDTEKPDAYAIGTENYHRYAHASILKNGFATLNSRLRHCTLETDERLGISFKFWKDAQGRVVKMERSDGQGYIQLFGVFGDAFGIILITPEKEPEASVCCNSNEYHRDMKWFLENH